MNKIILIGNLTRDPELTETAQGKKLCKFTIAVDRSFDKEKTDFFSCSAWEQKAEVISTFPRAKITLELADIEKFIGNNKPAKKLFVLTLIKANEQAIFNGELGRDYISFPLQELIDIGFYKTIQGARNGFKTALDALTDIKVSGELQKTKKNKISVIGLHPFRKAWIEKNQCYIQLESDFNWSFIAQYFTILPRYYFKLPDRASDLLYYIFFLARQHTRDIEERGYFTIGFRAIQHRLQLPSEVGLNNPQRDIKQPIEDAIEALETEHSKLYHNTEFSLLPVYDEAASVKDFLDNGYLKVTLTGAFAETYIAISKDTAKQIEADLIRPNPSEPKLTPLDDTDLPF